MTLKVGLENNLSYELLIVLFFPFAVWDNPSFFGPQLDALETTSVEER